MSPWARHLLIRAATGPDRVLADEAYSSRANRASELAEVTSGYPRRFRHWRWVTTAY